MALRAWAPCLPAAAAVHASRQSPHVGERAQAKEEHALAYGILQEKELCAAANAQMAAHQISLGPIPSPDEQPPDLMHDLEATQHVMQGISIYKPAEGTEAGAMSGVVSMSELIDSKMAQKRAHDVIVSLMEYAAELEVEKVRQLVCFVLDALARFELHATSTLYASAGPWRASFTDDTTM
jgi:hypothetical protein